MDSNLAFDAQFSEYMPQALGDPRRVRADKYHLFGIENTPENIEAGRAAYSSEWKRGGQTQNDLVSAAAVKAGFGDHSNKLRDLYAKVVSDQIQEASKRGKVIYVEPGAGKSTEIVYQELQRRGFNFDKLFALLIEPSDERRAIATDYLKSIGLREGSEALGGNFIQVGGRNYDIPDLTPLNTVDIIGSVATDHHEPDQTYPRLIEYKALRPGGIKINAEWCPPTCYHPSFIYNALFNNPELDKMLDGRWPTKEKDRKVFTRLFPAYLEHGPEFSPRDQKALEEIMKYWTIGYVASKIKMVEDDRMSWREDPNDIFEHEAHSITGDLIETYNYVGFVTVSNDIEQLKEMSGLDGNPHFLLPDSSIIAMLLAQKPKE